MIHDGKTDVLEEEMNGNPLETIKKLDPAFFDSVSQARELAFQDGALSAKAKYLIAMALDAAHGAAGGVTALAGQAREHGAGKEEIMEALQVANYISGIGCVYTASLGLAEVFKGNP
jgi:alkylhydroperoxidase/carboxymuconolactone decarboxylase family protein YurZ